MALFIFLCLDWMLSEWSIVQRRLVPFSFLGGPFGTCGALIGTRHWLCFWHIFYCYPCSPIRSTVGMVVRSLSNKNAFKTNLEGPIDYSLLLQQCFKRRVLRIGCWRTENILTHAPVCKGESTTGFCQNNTILQCDHCYVLDYLLKILRN